MTGAIEKRMKAKNRSAAGDVVDHWNHVSISPMRRHGTTYNRFYLSTFSDLEEWKRFFVKRRSV